MAGTISRRDVVARGLQVSLGGMLAAIACPAAAADKVCADLNKLDSGQVSLRKSLNYTELSADQSKTCSVCGFFQAADGGCGTCTIFNGPTNPKGHCDSWSAKS